MSSSSRRNIEKLIERSENEMIELHKALEMKVAYIQGLRDTLKYLPKDAMPEPSQPQLRPGTELAKAYEILREEGKPIHIMELLKRLGKEATHKNRVSLSGSMGFYVRKQQFFTRPAPNTFGVTDMGDAQRNGGTTGEPPDDFGIEEEKAET
jgi:hypothetical protein